MNEDRKKLVETTTEGTVPKVVANRLSLYLRELQQLIRDGHETTSSTQLGQRLGITDAQVRKDLAYFGQFGQPGVGYRCQELITRIRTILGTDREWRVAIVGLGNLGRALMGYRGFAGQGFLVVAAFDSDPAKISKSDGPVRQYHIDRLEEVVSNEQIRLAILAVPAEAAQPVAERLVQAGIKGILNFAPVTLNVPVGVHKVAVDLAIELEQLCFSVVSG